MAPICNKQMNLLHFAQISNYLCIGLLQSCSTRSSKGLLVYKS